MATLREIANQLHLTPSTVSHALSGKPGKVSEETRQRIARVAAEMGYVPNPAARALISPGRTGTVGFVSRRYNNALYAALLEAVAVAVDERGGNLVTCVTDRAGEAGGAAAQARLLHAGAVDGILAVPGTLPGLNAPDSPWMRAPIVFLLSPPDEARAPSVGFDEAAGVRAVVEHLRVQGRRYLLYLQGLGVDGGESNIGRIRLDHLRAVWTEMGGERLTVSGGFANATGGRHATEAALATGQSLPVDAIVAYNDQMAVGALRSLNAHGFTVPADVALVGWNDLGDIAGNLTPSLTSVRLSPAALARAALDLLYRQIDAPPAERRILVPATTHIAVPVGLAVRDSTRTVR